jgi:hypothetical protein
VESYSAGRTFWRSSHNSTISTTTAAKLPSNSAAGSSDRPRRPFPALQQSSRFNLTIHGYSRNRHGLERPHFLLSAPSVASGWSWQPLRTKHCGGYRIVAKASLNWRGWKRQRSIGSRLPQY